MPAAETEKLITKEEAAALKSDLDAIKKDIKQLFTDLRSATKHEAEFAGRKANELRDVATETARESRAEVEDYIRDHPLGSLAAAAGVGFILALLVGRN